MNKKKVISMILIGLILSGCQLKKEIKDDSGLYALSTGMANPASVNCEEKGGVLKIENGNQGQYGLCVFSDGSSCEEWAFLRGECLPGQSLVKYSWK